MTINMPKTIPVMNFILPPAGHGKIPVKKVDNAIIIHMLKIFNV